MPTQLRPAPTLSDVYGPGHVFFPRAVDGFCDWLPNAPDVLDSLTGGQIVIAGELPIVCSEGFNSAAGQELLGLAGLEIAPNRIHFSAGDELAALSTAAGNGARVVMQHALPAAVLETAQPWIAPELLQRLNNKAELASLVRAENVPARTLANREKYFADGGRQLPVVLKVVTEQSNGGGCGVMMCRTCDDLRLAEGLFARCEQIVVEQVLDIERNPCLNFAIMPEGEVRYLGFADQDLTPEGKYRGNWIDFDLPIDKAAVDVALEPVQRAAAIGYRGIAGVDLAFTPNGRIYVLDLNFRLNGCTPMILLAESLRERTGADVIHFRKFQGSLAADALARGLTPYVADGRLVALNLFDAARAGHAGKPASVQALVPGASREEVLAIEAEIETAIA